MIGDIVNYVISNDIILSLIIIAVVALCIYSFSKHKTLKDIVIALLGIIAFILLLFKKSNKGIDEKIDKLEEQKEQLKDEMHKVDEEVKENKEQFDQVMDEREDIETDLNQKLEDAQKIEPKPIESDQDILDAFDFAADVAKKKKKAK